MSQKHKEREIISITPASDWFAIYKIEENQITEISSPLTFKKDTEHFFYTPVACWALVDEGGDKFVVGMDGGDYLDFADHASNFVAYQHARTLKKWGVEL